MAVWVFDSVHLHAYSYVTANKYTLVKNNVVNKGQIAYKTPYDPICKIMLFLNKYGKFLFARLISYKMIGEKVG